MIQMIIYSFNESYAFVLKNVCLLPDQKYGRMCNQKPVEKQNKTTKTPTQSKKLLQWHEMIWIMMIKFCNSTQYSPGLYLSAPIDIDKQTELVT